jgi:hypothetical protein
MTTPHSIREPATGEVEQIKKLAIDTDMFAVAEVGFFDATLAGFFDGSLDDTRWLVVEGSRIREFYGPTDDESVFWKSLVGAPWKVDSDNATSRRSGAAVGMTGGCTVTAAWWHEFPFEDPLALECAARSSLAAFACRVGSAR